MRSGKKPYTQKYRSVSKMRKHWNVHSYRGCSFICSDKIQRFHTLIAAPLGRVMMDKSAFEAAAGVTKVMKCWLAPLTILSILCFWYCVGKLLWWILKMWLFAQHLLFLYVGVKKLNSVSSLGFFFSSTGYVDTLGILVKLKSNLSYKAIYSPQIYRSKWKDFLCGVIFLASSFVSFY